MMTTAEAIAVVHQTGSRMRPNELADLLHAVVHVIESLTECAPSVLRGAEPELGRDAADVLDLLEGRAMDSLVARAEQE